MRKTWATFILLILLASLPAFAGGAACKVIIDDSANNGMGEQLIGSVRQLQTVNDGVSKAILELEEYMTAREKEDALKLSYDACEFGEKMQEFAEKIRKFSDRTSDFYIEIAKRHAYDHDSAAMTPQMPTPQPSGGSSQ